MVDKCVENAGKKVGFPSLRPQQKSVVLSILILLQLYINFRAFAITRNYVIHGDDVITM